MRRLCAGAELTEARQVGESWRGSAGRTYKPYPSMRRPTPRLVIVDSERIAVRLVCRGRVHPLPGTPRADSPTVWRFARLASAGSPVQVHRLSMMAGATGFEPAT